MAGQEYKLHHWGDEDITMEEYSTVVSRASLTGGAAETSQPPQTPQSKLAQVIAIHTRVGTPYANGLDYSEVAL